MPLTQDLPDATMPCRLQHSSSAAAYASLDAARVGEGLYPQLVEAACLLAIDPSPRVAHAGRLALRTADVELIPVSTAASSAPASSLAPARELPACLHPLPQTLHMSCLSVMCLCAVPSSSAPNPASSLCLCTRAACSSVSVLAWDA